VKTGRVRQPARRLEGFEAMENRLEGVQHLLVLGSAVVGPDGGGASLGDVDKSRRGEDGGGRGTAVSWARTAAALMSARSTSVDAVTMAAAGGASAALLSAESTGVEAGTVAAAGAVTCMLTRALATWLTLSPRTADASAWSASILLRVGGKETIEGWSPCLLSS
jgi:hypothetical protein